MKKICRLLSRLNKVPRGFLPAAVLLFAIPSARAWDVGLINTIINYTGSGAGTAYGINVMAREEVFKYFDVGARTGYMKSDPLDAAYVQIGLSLALKYPLFENHFVPFVAVMGSMQFYDDHYRNSHASTPFWGCDIRFGEKREWSIYLEGLYQMGHTHSKGDDSAHQFRGLGGSCGLSYHF